MVFISSGYTLKANRTVHTNQEKGNITVLKTNKIDYAMVIRPKHFIRSYQLSKYRVDVAYKLRLRSLKTVLIKKKSRQFFPIFCFCVRTHELQNYLCMIQVTNAIELFPCSGKTFFFYSLLFCFALICFRSF